MVHMASPKSKQSKDDHEKVLRIKHTIAKNRMNPFSMNMAKVKLINIPSCETLVSKKLVEAEGCQRK